MITRNNDQSPYLSIKKGTYQTLQKHSYFCILLRDFLTCLFGIILVGAMNKISTNNYIFHRRNT